MFYGPIYEDFSAMCIADLLLHKIVVDFNIDMFMHFSQ